MMTIQEQLEMNMIFEDLAPMQDKKVAIYIGRFNPPTAGHYHVIKELKTFIRANPKLGIEFTPVVIVIGGSKSDENKKKNPLSADERISFMKASGNADGVIFLSATNAFKAIEAVRAAGYEPIAIGAGQERMDDYIKMLDKYVKTDDDKLIKHYPILLKRDEEAVDDSDPTAKTKAMDSLLAKGSFVIDNISGSLARRAVELGFKPEFAKIVGLEAKPKLADKMFKKIADAIKE
jgi:hypothetical protein